MGAESDRLSETISFHELEIDYNSMLKMSLSGPMVDITCTRMYSNDIQKKRE